MFIEFLGSMVMAGIFGFTLLDKNGTTEGSKLQRIAARGGLTTKADGKMQTIHLLRRKRHSWGTEYVFRIPLGLTFDDFQRKRQLFEDGLNHKRGLLDLSLDDFKALQLRSDLLEQIKKLLNGEKKRKEILMEYDGTLRMSIYREPLPEMVPFMLTARDWTVCVGLSREGIIYHDFDQIPHIVIAGTTRYGKSVFLKNVVTTLIHNQPAVRLTLIDLKGGLAFNRFANVRQVETVAKDAEEALQALRDIQQAMKQRQADFLARGVEDVKEARTNERHFIIIDEAAELASDGDPDKDTKKLKIECEKIIAEIARLGGGLGYRVVFATQYPTSETLPRAVKQNCDAKLCFRLQTEIASRVVLDESGAESLPYIRGRAIYRTDRKYIVQTPYIDNQQIDRIIRPHITIKRREEPHEHRTIETRGSHTIELTEI